ncbi:MAG: hypothetical protein NTV97_33515 [Alphaproteobacteria bacterium]|nr:hypothetical protein [Alphaproteobacteria bacterium]
MSRIASRAPCTVEIGPAPLAHGAAIELRAGDAMEVAALGATKDEAFRTSLARSLWAETYLVDGVPAAMVGLGLSAFVGGHGVPWLLTSPLCERHKKRFLVESRRQVARMLAEVSPLMNVVHADYGRAVRWLAWLGFTLDAPIEINGAPFRRFSMERSS